MFDKGDTMRGTGVTGTFHERKRLAQTNPLMTNENESEFPISIPNQW